jgi:hypothetical protein
VVAQVSFGERHGVSHPSAILCDSVLRSRSVFRLGGDCNCRGWYALRVNARRADALPLAGEPGMQPCSENMDETEILKPPSPTGVAIR